MTKRLMRYVARVGRHTGRYGQVVEVLEWHRSRVLVQFPDGQKAITPGRCLRRIAAKGADDGQD